MLRAHSGLLLAAALAPLAACEQPLASVPQSRAPAVQALGPAVRCIQTSRIDRTAVHDDRTIDFHMLGGTTYRNPLPHRCPSLGAEERFSYNANTGQLCSVDVITVLYSDGSRGAGCGLGEFFPVRISQAD